MLLLEKLVEECIGNYSKGDFDKEGVYFISFKAERYKLQEPTRWPGHPAT